MLNKDNRIVDIFQNLIVYIQHCDYQEKYGFGNSYYLIVILIVKLNTLHKTYLNLYHLHQDISISKEIGLFLQM